MLGQTYRKVLAQGECTSTSIALRGMMLCSRNVAGALRVPSGTEIMEVINEQEEPTSVLDSREKTFGN